VIARSLLLLRLAGCAIPPPAQYLHDIDPRRQGSFVVVGDLQRTSLLEVCREQNDDERRVIVDAIAAERPAFVVVLGDLVFAGWSRGAWAELDSLLLPWHDLPVLPLAGNHEYWGSNPCAMDNYQARFGPNVWRDRRHARLALMWLDSNDDELSPGQWRAQRRWYERRLSEFDRDPGVDGVLVFLHNPPYSNSSLTGDEPHVQHTFVPAFESAHKTLAMISGHAHGYEHIIRGGKHYLVSAGGGGPRVTYEQRHRDAFRNTRAKRPFNYLRMTPKAGRVQVEVMGLDKGESDVRRIDHFVLTTPPMPA
jgi:hypothetical protein